MCCRLRLTFPSKDRPRTCFSFLFPSSLNTGGLTKRYFICARKYFCHVATNLTSSCSTSRTLNPAGELNTHFVILSYACILSSFSNVSTPFTLCAPNTNPLFLGFGLFNSHTSRFYCQYSTYFWASNLFIPLENSRTISMLLRSQRANNGVPSPLIPRFRCDPHFDLFHFSSSTNDTHAQTGMSLSFFTSSPRRNF